MARASWTLVIGLVIGCGGDESAQEKSPPRRQNVVNVVPPAPKEILTDAQGNLLASDDKVLWFEIPKGFTRRDFGMHHVFTASDIESDRLEAFIGARALSRAVEREKRGVVFRQASPVSGAAGAPLEIAVAPGPRPGEIVLTVDEFPEPKAPSLPFAQARSALAEDLKRAE